MADEVDGQEPRQETSGGATATGCGAAQVLILDEISMISAEMFNALEQMARDLKGSQEPFGRIQLILAGDFFQ